MVPSHRALWSLLLLGRVNPPMVMASTRPKCHQKKCTELPLASVALKAFMSLEATALSGFGVLFGVSLHGRHSRLLQTVLLARHGEKDTIFPKE